MKRMQTKRDRVNRRALELNNWDVLTLLRSEWWHTHKYAEVWRWLDWHYNGVEVWRGFGV